MYTSMKEMLDHANENKYAVMAINCTNMEQARAICAAAAEEASPVIINVSPRQMLAHATPEVMVPMIRAIAEPLDVPIAFNLDHGDTYANVCRCLRAGFSSVMIDSSSYEFEENVRRTRMVTSVAHAYNASVEAELGHVGQAAAGDGRTSDMYTNVEQAVEFAERTHCDCLAVAIGTAHGAYPDDFVPRLDFDRLAELKAATKMPLVLHGGSGAGRRTFAVPSSSASTRSTCVPTFSSISARACTTSSTSSPASTTWISRWSAKRLPRTSSNPI